ncbi:MULTISPECIES: hypothetical protein [unclassified Deinococcus]|nr:MULTISPECIES: hypothetical protein [unclassified Deinococcus]
MLFTIENGADQRGGLFTNGLGLLDQGIRVQSSELPMMGRHMFRRL